MKKLLLILVLAITFTSCKKEYSFENNCGIIVVAKHINPTAAGDVYYLEVTPTSGTSANPTEQIKVGKNTFDLYSVGDSFCR